MADPTPALAGAASQANSPPRPAATVILLRDGDSGLELLMMRRVEASAFAGGAYVVPGGRVDPADQSAHWLSHAHGIDPIEANAQFGITEGANGYWIAAIRECFEESGLLFATDSSGHLVIDSSRFAHDRAALIAHRTTLLEIIERHQLSLSLDRLIYFSHWITQAGRPRRFDARFFIAAVPSEQVASHDGAELDHHVWINPVQALEQHRHGDFHMLFPTRRTLEELAAFGTVAEVLAYARADRPRLAMTPISAMGHDGPVLLAPGDHPYAEVSLLDPDKTGQVSCELRVGALVPLQAGLARITAPSVHPVHDGTVAGVNTYLLGNERSGIIVIDPGPDDARHVAAIIAQAPGAIRWILCTHTHRAHAGAAYALASATGAQLLGKPAPRPGLPDLPLAFDQELSGGETLVLGGLQIGVLATPGHAANHLCFSYAQGALIFTGDHIAQGPHSARTPADAQAMIDLVHSFAQLAQFRAAHIAPGHGFLMAHPNEMYERALTDRIGRENRVLRALRESDSGKLESLLDLAYHDLPAAVRPRWQDTLLAHLRKLQGEGRVTQTKSRWRLIA